MACSSPSVLSTPVSALRIRTSAGRQPDSRRSLICGLLSVRCSLPRFSCEMAMTGTSSSLARSLSARENSETSCWRLSTRLSLAAPTAAPTVSAGSGSLIGDYVAAYTFAIKDANGNVIAESDLSPLSASITLATEGLALSSIQQSSASGVTARRIYRSASGGDALYWAYDLEGNNATTYTSTELDVALDTVAVSEAGLGAAPGASDIDRLKLVVAWKDRLWGVSDIEPDNLRFSGARKPYAWDPFNMIPVPPVGSDLVGVTGFLPRRDELGVLKLSALHKIIGSNPDDFA